MRCIVCKADSGIQMTVATCIRGFEIVVHVGITMLLVVVVLHTVFNGWLTYLGIPAIICTCNQENFLQITLIRHGSLFIHQYLINDVRQFFWGRSRHTESIHFREIVAIDCTVIQVGNFFCFLSFFSANNVSVTNQSQEDRSSTSCQTIIVFLVNKCLDRGVCRSYFSFVCVMHIQIEALLSLPSEPRLESIFEFCTCNNKHTNRRIIQVAMIYINISIEELFISCFEIRAKRSIIQTLCSYFISSLKAYFDFDVVSNLQLVCNYIILNRINGKSCNANTTHCPQHFYLGQFLSDKTFACISSSIVNEGNLFGIITLAHRRLMWHELFGTVLVQRVNLLGKTFHANNRCGSDRHSNQLPNCWHFGRTNLTSRECTRN
ncbi:hypothetical protein Pgin01_01957 [Porphyromonas gingivalis]